MISPGRDPGQGYSMPSQICPASARSLEAMWSKFGKQKFPVGHNGMECTGIRPPSYLLWQTLLAITLLMMQYKFFIFYFGMDEPATDLM
jgi:hypothetical protein